MPYTPPLKRDTPLQMLRADRGLSLRDLAKLTGISRGLLSLYERGRYVPTEDEMARLMVALDVQLGVAGVTGPPGHTGPGGGPTGPTEPAT